VKPNGVKAWRYRFELSDGGIKKESVFAIGDYVIAPKGETPEQAEERRKGRRLTPSEAREERVRARSLVVQGINPAHHRQQERVKRDYEKAITFEAVAKEWLDLKDWEEITKSKRLKMLERVVFPRIGDLPIKAITPVNILDVLRGAAQENGPSVAA
jgi:hypothetical protein